MSGDTNVHRVVGNLLVGTSHFFVDTTTNRVGVNTSSPSASLDIATGDLKVGSGITLASGGTITATNFSGNGSGLSDINSDSGSWVKDDANSKIYVSNTAHKVGVGTSSPGRLLEVYTGNGTVPGLRLSRGAGAAYTDLHHVAVNVPNTGDAEGLAVITSDGNQTTQEVMRICGNMRVGIGRTNPTRELDVAGNINLNGTGRTIFFDATGGSGLYWGTGFSRILDDGDLRICTDDNMHFNTGCSPTTVGTERMVIKSDGDVGIGIAEPDEKLHVHGNIAISWNNNARIIMNYDNTYRQGFHFDAGTRTMKLFSTTTDSGGAIAFYTRGGAGSSDTDYGTERMRIDQNGRVKIEEAGGGTTASSSLGSLTLKHQNNYGSSSIVFPSKVNFGSDYAWIEYDEDGGEGGEAAKLKIGITNDHDDDIMLQASGGVGITSGSPTSTYHPFGKLEIQDPPSNSGVNNYRCYQSWKYGTGMWAIAVDNNTGPNHNLYWYASHPSTGSLQRIMGFENDTANRGTAAIFAFTGQHRNIVTINPSTVESCIGLIVSANNNENIKVQGGVERGLNAIVINETLPLLSITDTARDKSVFGVISGSEDPGSRENTIGRITNYFDKENGDDRVFVNSLGEGAIWVTNANGPMTSGDYVTSSNIPGYGMKQDSEFLANYTVAKLTMDCDFLSTPRIKYRIKKELKTLIGYKSEHCLITETQYENIEADYEKAKYTYQEREEYVNILDEHGQLQWEDSGETEAPYKVRYLLPDGTQISEEEYTTRALADEKVYVAAFVGCTYHCG